MNLKRYVLANPEARLPMPDRGGRLFSPKGETVDADSAFWAARVADGELIEVQPATPVKDIPPALPVKRKGK
nr:hypothetical protein [Mesorhizobium sp.]